MGRKLKRIIVTKIVTKIINRKYFNVLAVGHKSRDKTYDIDIRKRLMIMVVFDNIHFVKLLFAASKF